MTEAPRTQTARTRKVAHVLRLLERAYGKRPWRQWGAPVSVLVETILSQNTSDVNSSAGYRQLRRRYRTWNAVAAAPVGEIEKCIRVSGLSRIKAPRIQGALRRIRLDCAGNARTRRAGETPAVREGKMPAIREGNPDVHRDSPRGRISLDFLRRMSPQAATDYLRSLKGIGPKTAACVLLFSLKMPVFPVDTHILRIAKRLGWLSASASAEKAQETLTPLIPPRRRYAFHILLIEHGRRTCRARNPLCAWCQLLGLCPFGRTLVGDQGA